MSTRREYLKVGVAGALGLVVGGAAGYFGTSAEREALKSELESLKREAGIKLEDEIAIYNWTYYINRNLVDAWAEENGIKLIYDYLESNSEIYAKLDTGASGYDVMSCPAPDIPTYAERGLIEEVDMNKIPNFKHVPSAFKGFSWDPGDKYHVIWSYGTTGIGWNGEKVEPEITRWADVFEPERQLGKYSKKVSMMTDPTETLGAALFYLGRDPNSVKDEDLEEAKEVLIRQKPHLAKYASTEEFMEGLKTERFLISHAWNGDVAGTKYASDERSVIMEVYFPQIRYTVPEEGAYAWYDNLVIPKGAKHREAAHAFMNFTLDPRVAAINAMTIKYPYPTGTQYVPVELAKDPSIFTPEELLRKLVTYASFTPEERVKREEVWLEVQAA